MTRPPAAILDIDGTLVDTNYHHAVAWFRAFRHFDVTLPLYRIHRHIGMGGDIYVAAVAWQPILAFALPSTKRFLRMSAFSERCASLPARLHTFFPWCAAVFTRLPLFLQRCAALPEPRECLLVRCGCFATL